MVQYMVNQRCEMKSSGNVEISTKYIVCETAPTDTGIDRVLHIFGEVP